ncbi:MAG: nitroreductase family protein [Clostridia bacterium]|nr:nitroreductase family protein [Clostridia bacterium]
MFEINISPEWYDAIHKRHSVRQYTGAPTDEQLTRLGVLCKKLSWQGINIRMFRGPGLKSVIKGTNVYAVIVAKNGTAPELEGYMGEAFVLEATAMGLGTCWLGAGFNPDIVNKNVSLQNDEQVHCVIAIGQVTPSNANPKRRTLEQVCKKNAEELSKLGVWQQAAVEAARLAPSAINLQPWTIEVDASSLSVLERRVLINKYAGIDRGICMLHAAVGAASKCRNAVWKKTDGGFTMKA